MEIWQVFTRAELFFCFLTCNMRLSAETGSLLCEHGDSPAQGGEGSTSCGGPVLGLGTGESRVSGEWKAGAQKGRGTASVRIVGETTKAKSGIPKAAGDTVLHEPGSNFNLVVMKIKKEKQRITNSTKRSQGISKQKKNKPNRLISFVCAGLVEAASLPTFSPTPGTVYLYSV